MALEILDNQYEDWMKQFEEDAKKDKQRIKLLHKPVPLLIEKVSNGNFAEFIFGEPVLKEVKTIKIVDLNKKKPKNKLF